MHLPMSSQDSDPPGRWQRLAVAVRRKVELIRRKARVVRRRFLLGMVSGAGSACVSVAVVWWQNRR